MPARTFQTAPETGPYSWCRGAVLPVFAALILAELLLVPVSFAVFGRLPPEWRLWPAMLPFVAAILAALPAVRRCLPAGARWRGLDMEQPPLARLLPEAGIRLFPVWIAALILGWIGMRLCVLLGLPVRPHPLVQLLQEDGGAAVWLSVFVMAVLVGPLLEEIFFRLVLFEAMAGWGRRLAAVLAAALFAAMHQMPAQFPSLFFLGLALQWARARDRSLWSALLLHAGFNGLTLLLLFLGTTF